MKVLVCGSTGCIGRAVVRALRSRGHAVVEASRQGGAAPGALRIDYMRQVPPERWAALLAPLGVEAIVNCVGILQPGAQTFERVHARGPIELFRGASLAGVQRIVQVSALGVDDSPAALALPYLRSKLQADDALATLPLDAAVLRASLVYGPGSESARLFATLAALPVIALPGRGRQPVQPIHVYELAESIVRLLERPGRIAGVHEIGGPQPLPYREMLAAYRAQRPRGEALWLPVPMPAMHAFAALAAWWTQRAFSRDMLALLERGSVARHNAAGELLGRAPTPLARGLAVTPVAPAVGLDVQLSPALHAALRASIAFMWLCTAAVSALWPQASGVVTLLERCGFHGPAATAALLFSCALNTLLGVAMLWRPLPLVHAAQVVAVVAYTAVAAHGMPELLLDHCAPLAKNLPLLAALLIAWLGQPPLAPQRPATRPSVRAALSE